MAWSQMLGFPEIGVPYGGPDYKGILLFGCLFKLMQFRSSRKKAAVGTQLPGGNGAKYVEEVPWKAEFNIAPASSGFRV